MTSPRVRVAPTQVVLDTVPLAGRHWAALAVLLLLAAAAWWMSANRISASLARVTPAPWYALRAADDEAHVYTVLATGAAHRASVVIVGTSVAQASLWTDDLLTRAARLGIANLSTRGQSLIQSLYVLYSADLHEGQWVIVVTNPGQWTLAREDDYRLTSGLFGPVVDFAEDFRNDVPGLDAWLTPVGRRAAERGFQRQWLYRMIYGGLRRWSAVHLYGDERPAYDQHRQSADRRDGDLTSIESSRRTIQRRLAATFERNRAPTAHLMTVLLRFVKSRGAQAVLLDSPRIAGDSLRTYGVWWTRFREEELAFSDSNGVPIVDMNDGLAFSPSEFRDAWHLARAGRDRWSRAFLELVAQWCPEAGRPTGGCR